MSRRSEPWDDIEILLDHVRVEEEVVLAVMEALGELYDLARTDHLLQQTSTQSGRSQLMCLEEPATVHYLSAHYLNAMKGGRDEVLKYTDKMPLN